MSTTYIAQRVLWGAKLANLTAMFPHRRLKGVLGAFLLVGSNALAAGTQAAPVQGQPAPAIVNPPRVATAGTGQGTATTKQPSFWGAPSLSGGTAHPAPPPAPAPVASGAPAAPSAPAFAMLNARGRATVQERMRAVLRTGTITASVNNAARGITPSQIATIQRPDGKGTVQAIIKARDIQREVGASLVAEAMGLDFVPPTTVRVVNGAASSVQLMVNGLPTLNGAPLGKLFNVEANERFRAYDFIIGNGDRHGGNVLVREKGGELYPIPIDHNLALQPAPGWTGWDLRAANVINTRLNGDPNAPISAATKSFIAGIDSERVAKVLAGAGLDREASKRVLLRIERLKADPDLIQTTRLAQAPQIAANPAQGTSPEAAQRVEALLNTHFKTN
jgi:hypothetical protein